jgi:hypothetical protein
VPNFFFGGGDLRDPKHRRFSNGLEKAVTNSSPQTIEKGKVVPVTGREGV